MKIINFLIFLFILVVGINIINLNAQVHVGGIEEYIDYANITYATAGVNNSYENIAGSPFYFDEFIEGQIKLENGKIYQGPLRYDVYTDQIEFKTSNGKIYAVLNPESVDEVTIGETRFIRFENEVAGIKPGIFEISGRGDFMLLTKHQVELSEAEPAKPYVKAKPPSFEKKKCLFVLINPKGEMCQVKSKKDLINQTKSADPAIADFIKKNKINPADKNSLIDLINHLNEM